jgi:hypothetical protein
VELSERVSGFSETLLRVSLEPLKLSERVSNSIETLGERDSGINIFRTGLWRQSYDF